MSIGSVGQGVTPKAGEGVACSTFIAYAHAKAGNVPISSYQCSRNDMKKAADALWNAAHAACDRARSVPGSSPTFAPRAGSSARRR